MKCICWGEWFMINRFNSRFFFAVAIAVAMALTGSVQAATYYWDGTEASANADGGNGTWDTNSLNWDTALSGGANTNWINANNDTAVFAGTLGTVSLGTGITVGGVQFDTASYIVQNNTLTFGMSGNIVANQDATINSAIASTTGLTITKTGGGTLTLGGNNTYAGNTTISVGTLKAGSITALSANSAFSVSSGAILDLGGFNNTIKSLSTATGTITNSTGNATLKFGSTGATAQLFTGNLGLQISGGQNTDLTSAGNTFSGGTILGFNDGANNRILLNSRTLGVGNPGALTSGQFGTGAITIGVSATDRGQIYLAGASTINNAIVVNTALGNTDNPGAFQARSTGNVINGTISANLAPVTFQINQNSGTGGITLSNTISGASGLTLLAGTGTPAGSLTVTLANTGAANSYAGDTVISSVKETLTLGAANQIPNGASKGNLVMTNGTFNLGGFSETINGLSGTGTVDGATSGTPTPTLTVGDNDATGVSNTFFGVIKNTAGTLALTKIGSGVLTLSGTNTYAGTTTISVGTLKAGSATGLSSNSAFSVAAGAILDLGGFNNTIKSLATATGTITNSAGNATLKISTAMAAATAQLFTGSMGVQFFGQNNAGTILTNSANTYSGGTILGIGTGIAVTRVNLSGSTIGAGSPGTLTSGVFGTGAITIGAAATDFSQIFFGSPASTINNAIVVNTAQGADFVGSMRLGVAGNVLAGAVNANLADLTFVGSGSVSVTGTIFGISGVAFLSTGLGNSTLVTLANTGTANSYAGNTTMTASGQELTLGAADQIPNGAGKGNLIVTNGTFKMGGFSETINGLSGNGTVDGATTGTPSPTLTVGDNDATGTTNTFSGVIKNTAGTLSLTKIGAGTLTLSGINTYSGATTVSNGTLVAGANFVIRTNSAVTVVSGATFTNNFLQAIGSLAGDGNVILGASGVLSNGYNNTSTTFGGIISGDGLLAKYGAGVLSLSNNNTYAGNTTINAGKLQFVVGGSCSNSTVILNAVAATNSVSVTANTLSWTCSNLTASAAGVLEFNFGAITPSTNVSPLNIISNATFTATPTVKVLVDSGLAAGTYPLMTWGAKSGTAPTNLIVSTTASSTTASLSVSGNTLNLVIYSMIAGPIYWDNNGATAGFGAAAGTWAAPTLGDASQGWSTNAAGDTLPINFITAISNTLNFGTSVAGLAAGTITINGSVSSSNITFASASGDIVLTNGAITLPAASTLTVDNSADTIHSVLAGAATSLTKDGTGILTLGGVNTYSGATAVSNGTLKAGSTTGLSSNSVFSVAAGATLDLGGFTNTISSLSTATGTITNSGSVANLTITTVGSGAGQLFTGNMSLTLNTSTPFTNPNSTYSGGTTLIGGRPIFPGSVTIGAGIPGALTGGLYGTGAITIGANATSFAQLYFQTGITLNNAIVVNSALGENSSYPGAFRVEGAGIVLAGAINANLADAMFETANALGQTISVSNTISGALGLRVLAQNAGGLTVTLANTGLANSYAGNTTISSTNVSSPSAILKLGAANQIPNGIGKGNLIMTNGVFNMGGFSETINGLSGTGIVDGATSGTPTPTLTIGDNDASGTTNTFSGVIKNTAGTLSLTKVGSGTLTLSGTNTYSGATTVSNGTLLAGANFVISTNSAVTVVSGATFTNNFLQAIGSLAGDGNVILGVSGVLSNGFNNTSTTFGGIISGTGLLAKYGAGILSLSNNNTYSGVTTISGGTLRISGAGQLGNGNYATNMAVGSGAVFDYSSSADQILSGVISAAGALIKSNSSILTLSGENTYSGNTTINAGKLQVVVGGSCSNSTVVLASATATNSVSVTDNTRNWTCSSLTASAAGVMEFSFGAVTPSTNVSPLNVIGLVDFTATPTVKVVVDSGLAAGTYSLMTWGTKSGTAPTTANLIIPTMAANTAASLSISGNTLNLVIINTITGSAYWDNDGATPGFGTAAGTWAAPTTGDATQGWSTDVAGGTLPVSVTTSTNNPVNFGNGSAGLQAGTITVSGSVSNGNMTFALGSGAIVLTNGTITLPAIATITVDNSADTIHSVLAGAATSLTKAGVGTLTLGGVNTYSGATTVSNGTLKAGSTNGLSANSAFSVAAGATLDLGGFTNTIKSLGSDTVTSIITNSTGAAMLRISTAMASTLNSNLFTGSLGLQIFGGGTLDTLLMNTANNYSGGTILGNGSGSTATRVLTGSNLGAGSPGALTSGLFGTGVITIGATNTDRSQIYFAGGITINNAIVVNSALGDGSFAGTFRVESTGCAIAGTINANLAAAAFGNYSLNAGGINLSGVISGSSGLTLLASGSQSLTVTLTNAANANSYSGDTTISSVKETLTLGASDQIPNGTGKGNLIITNGTFNMGGYNETINGLSGSGIVEGFSGTPTLTVGDNDATGTANTFSGVIKNTTGSLTLTKIGAGTLILSGANTYKGATTVSNGTLVAGANFVISTNSAVTVVGGTTFTNNYLQAIGSLAGDGNVILGASGVISNGFNNTSTTFGGIISGTGLLAKYGTGVLSLTNVNTYSGNTTINAGKLQFVVGGSISNSPVVLAATAATNSVSVTDPAKSWACSNLTASAAGVLEFSFGAVTPSISVSPLNIISNATFTATPTVSVLVNSPGLAAGTYPLMTWGGTSGTAPTNLIISSVAPNTTASLSVSGNTLNLVISSAATAGPVYWDNNGTTSGFGAAGGTWAAPTLGSDSQGWSTDGTGITLPLNIITSTSNTVNFGNGSTGLVAGTITVNGSVSSSNMTFASGSGEITLSGGTITFPASAAITVDNGTDTIYSALAGAATILTKAGAGTLMLSGTNNYSGATAISNGTLKVGSTTALSSNSAFSVAAGATLDLGGYGNTISNLAVDTATSIITNSTGSATLRIRTALSGAAIAQLFTGSLGLQLYGGNTVSVVLGNANNSFSGGTILGHGSGSTQTRVLINGVTIGTGSPGSLTKGYFGTGTIALGATNTDLSQIMLQTGTGCTINNAIVINSALGLTGEPGAIRVDSTGNVIAGTINANLASATFCNRSSTGAINLTGAISGNSGLMLLASVGTSLGVTLTSAPNTNSYAGNTTISSVKETLTLGRGDQIPNGTGKGNLIITAGAFNMGGSNETINGLSGNGTVDGVSGTPTLTVGDNDATGAENTFSGVIKNTVGTLALTKIGSGALTLSGTNTYGGNTTINAGKLQLVVGGSCSNSTVILANATATNSVSVTVNTLSWTCSNLTANASGVMEFSFGNVTPSLTVSPLNIRSTATFTVTPAVSVLVSSGLALGTYPLMTWGSSSGTVPMTANLTVSTLAGGTAASLSVTGGNTLNLVISDIVGSVYKIR